MPAGTEYAAGIAGRRRLALGRRLALADDVQIRAASLEVGELGLKGGKHGIGVHGSPTDG